MKNVKEKNNPSTKEKNGFYKHRYSMVNGISEYLVVMVSTDPIKESKRNEKLFILTWNMIIDSFMWNGQIHQLPINQRIFLN